MNIVTSTRFSRCFNSVGHEQRMLIQGFQRDFPVSFWMMHLWCFSLQYCAIMPVEQVNMKMPLQHLLKLLRKIRLQRCCMQSEQGIAFGLFVVEISVILNVSDDLTVCCVCFGCRSMSSFHNKNDCSLIPFGDNVASSHLSINSNPHNFIWPGILQSRHFKWQQTLCELLSQHLQWHHYTL